MNEKIRQVVVDYQHKLWDVSVSFTTNLNLLHRKSQEVLREALTAQLDAIIDGEQNRVDDLNWLHRRAELPQLKRDFLLAREEVIGTLARLKEARSSLDSGGTSITNSTHER